MGQTEWTEKTTSSYPIIDLNMEGVETEGQKQIEWENIAEKRRITYIVFGGGSWQDTWTKILILSSTDPLVGTELMRVEVTKDGDTGKVNKAVFVDVFKYDGGKGRSANFVYDLDNDGRREDSGHVSNISEAEVEEYFETLMSEMVRTLPDLPEQIDVEETIRLFLEQIQERRLGIPALISA
jgi:hypothetical protein